MTSRNSKHHLSNLFASTHLLAIWSERGERLNFKAISIRSISDVIFWMLWTVRLLFRTWTRIFFNQEMLISRTWTEKTLVSVQDQLFDHKLDMTEYYLDQDVQVDIKVCFLRRFFNEMMQKMTRLVSLTADFNASTELSKKQKAEFRNHSKIIRLSNRNKTLTAQLKLQSYKLISTAKETSLYNQKMRAQARLNSFKVELQHSMIKKSRKRHFWKIDTIVFDLQFSASSNQKNSMSNEFATRRKYNISERVEIVRWICQSAIDLTDEKILTWRIKDIEVLTILCRRQKTQRRDRSKRSVEQEESKTSADDMKKNIVNSFLTKCKSKQCIFCLSDDRKLYEKRTFKYSKVNKMLNEIEKHLKTFTSDDKISCLHSRCKTVKLILSNVMTFKNHTAKVHKIVLRE